MKILMLNYEFPPVGGGGSPVTFELCRHLVKLGHDVDVVTMRYKNLPAFECVDGVNIYRTWAIRGRPDICRTHEMATYIAGGLPTALRLLRRKRHDVIHCHFIIPSGVLAWLGGLMTGVPYLITCHGSDVPGYNPDRFKLAHKLLMPMWQFLVRRTPLLSSPSGSLKELVLSHCLRARITVVPNGIYPSSFDLGGVRERSILLCSRVLPRKGFQYALEAIEKLRPDWQVHVVGDGPYLPQLKRQAQGMETPVKFWGWLDKKDPQFKNLFAGSSIFIFTSEAENFPMVLLEAMSAGLAIITSTAGGCPEVVGDAALLVPPRDAEAIRSQLEKLIGSEQLRRQLSRAAVERVRQFGWPHVAEQYLSLYQKLQTMK